MPPTILGNRVSNDFILDRKFSFSGAETSNSPLTNPSPVLDHHHPMIPSSNSGGTLPSHQFHLPRRPMSNPNFSSTLRTMSSGEVTLQIPSTSASIMSHVEQQLLSLSNMYFAGFSTTDYLLNGNPGERLASGLSKNLKMALCYRSTLIAKTPALFSGNKNPSFSERFAAANYLFGTNFLKDGSQPVFGNQELCDNIRAMLIHSMTLLGLENWEEAKKLMDGAISLAKKENFFDLSAFGIDGGDAPLLDLDYFQNISPVHAIHLTPAERQERLSILMQCALSDTYASLLTGQDFRIEDDLIPDLDYALPSRIAPELVFYQRQQTPSFAAGSIWENGPFATMLDDMTETRLAMHQFKDYNYVKSLGLLKNTRLFRKIIQFTRNDFSKLHYTQSHTRVHDLHIEILSLLEIMPSSMLAVPSLECWSDPNFGAGQCAPMNLGRCSSDNYQFFLVFLAMIAHLHLPMALENAPMLYPLSLGSASSSSRAGFTSKELLFIVLRAVDYFSQMAYTPVVPTSSFFGPFQSTEFDTNNFSNIMIQQLANQSVKASLEPHIPSPMCFDITTAILLFLISKATIQSAQKAPVNEENLAGVKQILQNSVLPCLNRIGSLFPLSLMFAKELQSMH